MDAIMTMARLPMTVFSAVTHVVATLITTPLLITTGNLHPSITITPYLFTLLCQLSAHFAGEYYDWPSDRIQQALRTSATSTTSPHCTGGSKEHRWNHARRYASFLALITASLATLIIVIHPLPHPILAALMLLLSLQYSAPPLKLNHRALGELIAPLVMNILLPLYAASANASHMKLTEIALHPLMLMLIIPSTCTKFALFLILNLADRRADFIGNKITLPVLLGSRISVKLINISLMIAIASSTIIAFLPIILSLFLYPHTLSHSSLSPSVQLQNLFTMILFLFTSIRPTIALRSNLLRLLQTSSPIDTIHLPDSLIRNALILTPQSVIASLITRLVYLLLLSFTTITSMSDFYLTNNWLFIGSLLAPLLPFLYTLRPTSPRSLPSPNQPKFIPTTTTIVILGGGIAGLSTATLLARHLRLISSSSSLHQRPRVRLIILEKRSQYEANNGADLGLWPSAMRIVRQLCDNSDINAFLHTHTYPIHSVHMDALTTNLDNSFTVRPLRTVNMLNVIRRGKKIVTTRNMQDCFRLVSRRSLMQLLGSITATFLSSPSTTNSTPSHQKSDIVDVDVTMEVLYDTHVVKVHETPYKVEVTYNRQISDNNDHHITSTVDDGNSQGKRYRQFTQPQDKLPYALHSKNRLSSTSFNQKDHISSTTHNTDSITTVFADIVIGADGITSLAREEVHRQVAMADPDDISKPHRTIRSSTIGAKRMTSNIRYSGEVCYRGILPFDQHLSPTLMRECIEMVATPGDYGKDNKSDPKRDTIRDDNNDNHAWKKLYLCFLRQDYARPNSMMLWYGSNNIEQKQPLHQYRSAWGFINAARTTGYWWVKEPQSFNPNSAIPIMMKREAAIQSVNHYWAQPLRMCWGLTSDCDFYIQPIVDRISHPSWCSPRIVLMGDAAHPVTPNNAQGATMAFEDAEVLAALLAPCIIPSLSNCSSVDPFRHIDAFIAYIQLRQPHVDRVAKESQMQSLLSQWQHPLLIRFREFLLRRLPASLFERKLAATNLWHWQQE